MKNNCESEFSGNDGKINRRDFLKKLGLVGLGLAVGGMSVGCEKQTADEVLEVGELYDHINNKEKPVEICEGLYLRKANGLSMEFSLEVDKFSEEKLELMFPIYNSQVNYYAFEVCKGLSGKCNLSDCLVYDGRTMAENNYTNKINNEKVVGLRILLDPADNYVDNFGKEKADQNYKFISRSNHNSIWESEKKVYNVSQLPVIYSEKDSDGLLIGVDNSDNLSFPSGEAGRKFFADIYNSVKHINLLVNDNNSDLGIAINQILFFAPCDQKNKKNVLAVLPSTLFCQNDVKFHKYPFLKNNIILSNQLLIHLEEAKKAVLYESIKQYAYLLLKDEDVTLRSEYQYFDDCNGRRVFNYRTDNPYGTVVNVVDRDKEIDFQKQEGAINNSAEMFACIIASIGYDFQNVVKKIDSISDEEDRQTLKGIIHCLVNILGSYGEDIIGDNYREIKKYLEV